MAERTDKAGPGKHSPKAPDPELVPDVVLEELLAAFSEQDGGPIDFDDPSIDRLLGLGDNADSTAGNLDGNAIDDTGTGTGIDTTTPAEPTDVLTASDSTGATTDTVVLIPPSAKVDTADEVEKVDKPTEAAAKPAVKVIAIDDDDRPDALYLDEESGYAAARCARRRIRRSIDDHHQRSRRERQHRSAAGSLHGVDGSQGSRPANRSSPSQGAQAADLGCDRRSDPGGAGRCHRGAGLVAVRRAHASTCRAPCTPIRHSCRQIVDDIKGDAILLVDTRAIEQKLENIAWVESARVTTQFPHDVFIDIRERKPIATFAGSDNKYRVIDRDGRVLDVVDGVPIDYMLVTGANPDADRGQFAGRPFAAAAQLRDRADRPRSGR